MFQLSREFKPGDRVSFRELPEEFAPLGIPATFIVQEAERQPGGFVRYCVEALTGMRLHADGAELTAAHDAPAVEVRAGSVAVRTADYPMAAQGCMFDTAGPATVEVRRGTARFRALSRGEQRRGHPRDHRRVRAAP